MEEGIRNVDVQIREDGNPQEVSVTFGPHHDLRIYEDDDALRFRLVYTHHGFEVTASGDPPTELEDVINLVREERDDLIVD